MTAAAQCKQSCESYTFTATHDGINTAGKIYGNFFSAYIFRRQCKAALVQALPATVMAAVAAEGRRRECLVLAEEEARFNYTE